MNFTELTRVMLHSMDFFELRRTAARYGVPYQGVRRNKLIRDIERKIVLKNSPARQVNTPVSSAVIMQNSAPSQKKVVNQTPKTAAPRINTYSRCSFTRFYNK